MASRTFVIRNPHGLHARPARLLAEAAAAHAAAVRLRRGDKIVNARSILGLLTLGAKCGDRVMVEIDDDDEATLNRFGEILGHAFPEDIPADNSGTGAH